LYRYYDKEESILTKLTEQIYIYVYICARSRNNSRICKNINTYKRVALKNSTNLTMDNRLETYSPAVS